MSKQKFFSGSLALCATLVLPIAARAAFHLWDISEVYSNASGSVQFVELFTNGSGQIFTSGTQITSNGKTFSFPSNIATPPDTIGRHLLLATAGFGSLPGAVAPDFKIPSNFFSPSGDHIQYLGAVGDVTFGPTPTNGVSSFVFAGGFPLTATNSPTNYAGATGSLRPSPEPSGIVLLVLGTLLLAAIYAARS
jgi:hypothetical protein